MTQIDVCDTNWSNQITLCHSKDFKLVLNTYDKIWYGSTNMSRRVQTCPDMSRHVQTCPDYQSCIRWRNTQILSKSETGIWPWRRLRRQSRLLDRFEQVERSKIVKRNKSVFFDTYQGYIGSQTHTVHMTSGSSIIQSIQDLKYENNLGFPQKNIRDFAFISLKVWHWLLSEFPNILQWIWTSNLTRKTIHETYLHNKFGYSKLLKYDCTWPCIGILPFQGSKKTGSVI